MKLKNVVNSDQIRALGQSPDKRDVTLLDELQLQVDYIDLDKNLISIYCKLPEEIHLDADDLISDLGKNQASKLKNAAFHYPQKIKIKLSVENLQSLTSLTETSRDSIEHVSNFIAETVLNNPEGNDFLNKIFGLIEDNMSDETYWVDDLSFDMNVSRSTLFRKLKCMTGQAPNEFMRAFRLQHAANLLQQGNLRVAEVAYKVGFTDPNYFGKCFRKSFGKSPSNYAEKTKISVEPQMSA